MSKKLVILGCGGFIGSHLLDRLLQESGWQIDGFDTQSDKITQHFGNPNFRFYKEDIYNSPELDRLIGQCDVVISLAAICNPSQYNTQPLRVIDSNFIHAQRIVEICAAQKKWLLHFSTSEVYGRTISSYLPDENYRRPELFEQDEDETPFIVGPLQNQRWTYACAKQLLERFIYAHHQENGMPFTLVRPFNFFGPRMDFIPGRDGEGLPRVLACFMTALLDGTPLQLVDGGLAKRTLLYIEDAIDAVIKMLNNPDAAKNQVFNLGNRENEVSMAQLAVKMRDIYAQLSQNTAYHQHPVHNVSGLEFYGKGYEDCDRRMPKIDKALNLLGWKASTNLQDTLLKTMQYYYDRFGQPNSKPTNL